MNWAGREGVVRGRLPNLKTRLNRAMFARAQRSTMVYLARVRETAPFLEGGWLPRVETRGRMVFSRTCRDAALGQLGRE